MSDINDDLKQLIIDTISEQCPPQSLAIYDCDDCGARFAALIIVGPKVHSHAYLAAGGGDLFVASCCVCGGTMVSAVDPERRSR